MIKRELGNDMQKNKTMYQKGFLIKLYIPTERDQLIAYPKIIWKVEIRLNIINWKVYKHLD